MLKKWTHNKGTWSSEVLWERSWGGKFDRLRDIEVGDVNGDVDVIKLLYEDAGKATLSIEKDGIKHRLTKDIINSKSYALDIVRKKDSGQLVYLLWETHKSNKNM